MITVSAYQSGFAVGGIALTMGLADAAPELSAANIAAGGALLIAAWVGRSINNVVQRHFEAQGEKLLSLPTAEQLRADKASLLATLSELAHESSEERKSTSAFRETLMETLADHRARIVNIERRCDQLHVGGK